jgi:hypothetical protein
MVSGSQLRHHTTIFCMEFDLRIKGMGEQTPLTVIDS